MRPTRHVTAVMLLAAFGAVGCSKRNETPKAKTASSESAQTSPVLKTAAAVLKTDGEGFHPNVAPKISGSFADGDEAYHARKYGEAKAIFEGYVDRRPNNQWGHYMLGLSAWKSGDLDRSEQAFEQALSIDPSHMKSLVNESRLFIDQKRYDDAIDRLTRASEVDSESAVVYRLLGRTYLAKGETDEAIEAYRAAIEIDEHDAWSMNNLALIFLQTKRADEALPLLARAVELRGNVAEFHNNLGMALEHTGRFKAAAKAYGDALTANPDYGKAKKNLARVEAVKGGPEEPFEVERAAKTVDPASKDNGAAEIADDERAGSK
jgi:tetratricopeptide (TPR) repeat protein